MPTTTKLWGRRERARPALYDRTATDAGVRHLFALVVDGLARASAAFVTGDREEAARLVAAEPEVDLLHTQVEDVATAALLARDSFVSDGDTRFLVSVLRIVPELERSADLVEHIALRTNEATTSALSPETRALFADMGETATRLWMNAASAWHASDARAADALRSLDDHLDDLHVQVTESLSGSGISTSMAIELGLVARFFERLGDHAVNVTRRLAFLLPREDAAP